MPTILLVDDDPAIREMLRLALMGSGYQVQEAGNALDARETINKLAPDLILLDWMMPGVSGIELTRRLRKDDHTSEIPIIMLTARITEDDKVTGLDAGADDYLIKPFSPRELCARISSRLRVQQGESSRALSTDGLLLDQHSYRVSVEGMVVTLGPTEFRLLRHFMSNKERVMTRNQLLDSVWGTNVYIEERTVDVHVRRLRKALEPFGKSDLIQTVRGVGYRFSDQV